MGQYQKIADDKLRIYLQEFEKKVQADIKGTQDYVLGVNLSFEEDYDLSASAFKSSRAYFVLSGNDEMISRCDKLLAIVEKGQKPKDVD